MVPDVALQSVPAYAGLFLPGATKANGSRCLPMCLPPVGVGAGVSLLAPKAVRTAGPHQNGCF